MTVDLSGFSEWIDTHFFRESNNLTEDGAQELKFSYCSKEPQNILLYKNNNDFEVHAKHFAKRLGGYNALHEFSFKETWRLNFRMLDSEGMPLNDVLNNLLNRSNDYLHFAWAFLGISKNNVYRH